MANCKTRIGCVEIRISYWLETEKKCGTLEDARRLEPDCYVGLICYATVLKDRRIKFLKGSKEFAICWRDYRDDKMSIKRIKKFIAYSRKVAELFSSLIIGLSSHNPSYARNFLEEVNALGFGNLFNLDYLNCVFVEGS